MEQIYFIFLIFEVFQVLTQAYRKHLDSTLLSSI